MAKDLTDRYVKTLKATGARIETTDSRVRGLTLRCSPTGLKSWSYDYRSAGKHRRIALGEYPEVTLQEARDLAGQWRTRKNMQDDPRLAQNNERVEQDKAQAAEAIRQVQAGMTFNTACDLYLVEIRTRPTPKASWKNDEGYLKRPRAELGDRPVSSITKKELTAVIAAIASTAPSSANRTQSVLRTLWAWAADKDCVPMNFLAGLKKIGGKETAKERVLTDGEILMLFEALDSPDVEASEIVCLALKMVLLTAQRPGEVAGMMVSELHDLDGQSKNGPHWLIPGIRTKNKKSGHNVPLSPTAVGLIRSAIAARKDGHDADDGAVFGSRYEDVDTIARHSLSRAVRRIVIDNELQPFTPHDLRRTGATLAQAARLPIDFIKALLNHNDKGVTGVYARWNMFEEKREAVLAIERSVLAILHPAPSKEKETVKSSAAVPL